MHTGHMATVGLSIESANVVGYQNKDVRKNLSQQVCTFDVVGGDGSHDIQTLLPVDDEGVYVGDGDINIQFINDRGKFLNSFAYYGVGELSEEQTVAGWYDEDSEELADYTFASGEAFQVSAASACNFVYAGEVNMAETDVPFRKNLSFQANVRPTSVDIQGIIPVDGEGAYIGDGDINIQFFTDRGKFTKSYAYYGVGELSEEQTVAGWYDEDSEELADYTFAAGEGFKLSAGSAGYLRFPEL